MTTHYSQQNPTDTASDSNALEFILTQFMSRVWTSLPVLVESVSNQGELAPVGVVSVRPLVNMMDGEGNVVDHTVIYNVPYIRIQGGDNAIIIDPEPGDIGTAFFCHRDISLVKRTKAPAAPGSLRRFHPSDAFYQGGTLNAAPTQYARFSKEGIELVSPKKITLHAPEIESNCDTFTVNAPDIVLNGALEQGSGSNAGNAKMAGSLEVEKEVTANGIKVSDHEHSGVQTGNGNTGKPVA